MMKEDIKPDMIESIKTYMIESNNSIPIILCMNNPMENKYTCLGVYSAIMQTYRNVWINDDE